MGKLTGKAELLTLLVVVQRLYQCLASAEVGSKDPCLYPAEAFPRSETSGVLIYRSMDRNENYFVREMKNDLGTKRR
jgi:hypothetical protein